VSDLFMNNENNDIFKMLEVAYYSGAADLWKLFGKPNFNGEDLDDLFESFKENIIREEFENALNYEVKILKGIEDER